MGRGAGGCRSSRQQRRQGRAGGAGKVYLHLTAASAKGSVLGAGGARAPGSASRPYLGAVGSVLRHFPPQEQAAGGVFHSHKS